MSTKVFISYRRDDSAAHAGRINDRLERELGRDSLFTDVDAIPLGLDFVEILSARVAECEVLLAIIGPNWLEAHDEDGNRRLDDEHDFVRIEIGAALQRNIPVIPILLEGTRVPKATRLPDNLKPLARRNGLDVRHASFHADMDKLIRALRTTAPPAPAPLVHDRPIAPPEPESSRAPFAAAEIGKDGELAPPPASAEASKPDPPSEESASAHDMPPSEAVTPVEIVDEVAPVPLGEPPAVDQQMAPQDITHKSVI